MKADSRIAKQYRDDDGYWIHLVTGFADKGNDPLQPTHVIVESTKRDAVARMSDVDVCKCHECIGPR